MSTKRALAFALLLLAQFKPTTEEVQNPLNRDESQTSFSPRPLRIAIIGVSTPPVEPHALQP